VGVVLIIYILNYIIAFKSKLLYFFMAEIFKFEHVFWLYPEAEWLADAVLKRNNFLTTREQSSVAFIASGFEKPNAFRDLELLARGPNALDIPKELNKVKQEYNELLRKLIEASPRYIDLTWQVFRRMGAKEQAHRLVHRRIECIFNPPKPFEAENSPCAMPYSRTDEERVEKLLQFGFQQEGMPIEEVLQTTPVFRLVEFDKDYFYGTGRYAFAMENGDIFQTIWDRRQREVPFFAV
jgi:hypothetical protein